MLELQGEQVLLRVYLRGGDRTPHVATHTLVLQAAHHEKLAGATVLHGILGFGHRGWARRLNWSLVDHAPVIIEIVDTGSRISEFIHGPLDEIMYDAREPHSRGLLTLERAAVMMYRPRGDPSPSDLCLASPKPPLSTLPNVDSGTHMTLNSNGILLRVFIGDSDRFENRSLHEAILHKAREMGLSGATVLRGSEGFGANSVVHKSAVLEMSADLPIVIELADDREKIEPFLPHLQAMVHGGMITMEQVMICAYRQNPADAPGMDQHLPAAQIESEGDEE